jgi:hypothetical protein
VVAGLHRAALLAHLGADAVDLEAHVDAVHHRSLVGYSATRFWLKKPSVCFDGVAVRPMRWASKYSSTCRHRP